MLDLRELRLEAGLSLRGLAERSGYSKSYLSRVEAGERSATPIMVRMYTTLSRTNVTRDSVRLPEAVPASPRGEDRLDLGIVWFGAEARRRRMAEGLSLSALGRQVFVSAAYLCRIEQGEARGTRQIAVALDAVLDAGGSLVALFDEECGWIGPIPPDTDHLSGHANRGRPPADPVELAAAAEIRLQWLKIHSHQAGLAAVLPALSQGVVELYDCARSVRPIAAVPVWSVALRHAEMLGWVAQETGHDSIALRWTRLAADWASAIGDREAVGYTLIRQSQWARRRGDANAAIDYACRAAATPRISQRIRLFASQREAQAYALAGDEESYRGAVDRYRRLADRASMQNAPASDGPRWGPSPDPAFENSRLLEATCLVDLGDFRAAAALFDEHMGRLGDARTGYARLAVREALAYANVGDAERACEVAGRCLPTVARQGSASLRGDLLRLSRTLNRHRRRPAVRDLLPDLARLARAAGTAPATADGA